MTRLEVTVAFTGGKTIEAACVLISDRPFKEDVAFSLAAFMEVTGCSAARYEQTAQYDYLPPVRRVVIEGSGGKRRVDFEYSGEVGGWGAAIKDGVRCLNYQSAWRPFELTEDVDLHINSVKPEKGWLVITGLLKDGFLAVETVVKENSLSELTAAYGLFMVNTEKCVRASGESLSAYCVSSKEEAAVKEACRVYDDILTFYHGTLYPPLEGENRVLISLSEEENTGGYFTPDVHHRGVLLFYLLYKVYGEKAVARLLTIFQQLPAPKTTEKYLAAVREYNAGIARDIEKALELVVF